MTIRNVVSHSNILCNAETHFKKAVSSVTIHTCGDVTIAFVDGTQRRLWSYQAEDISLFKPCGHFGR